MRVVYLRRRRCEGPAKTQTGISHCGAVIRKFLRTSRRPCWWFHSPFGKCLSPQTVTRLTDSRAGNHRLPGCETATKFSFPVPSRCCEMTFSVPCPLRTPCAHDYRTANSNPFGDAENAQGMVNFPALPTSSHHYAKRWQIAARTTKTIFLGCEDFPSSLA